VEGKNREPVASLTLYHLLKWSVVSPALHTYFRIKIHGANKVPMSGGLIAVSNHASYFDPPILSNCVGRPVAFMAKEELFKIPEERSHCPQSNSNSNRIGLGSSSFSTGNSC